MPTAMMNMDDDSPDEQRTTQSRKHQKAVSGKLRTADNTVVKVITWPHELIYTPACQPANYEDLSPMLFVNGYLDVLTTVDQDTTCRSRWLMVKPTDGMWSWHTMGPDVTPVAGSGCVE